LSENPARLNEDPYGDGWICTITVEDPAQLDELLDAEGYRALIEG
jgi:glycine cleavage system H protein